MIRREGVSVLHVTHSSAEAAAIADRIVRIGATAASGPDLR
jgi:ABC-type nitrate/sulfonate/bicarbonate transport system ATPase subunit